MSEQKNGINFQQQLMEERNDLLDRVLVNAAIACGLGGVVLAIIMRPSGFVFLVVAAFFAGIHQAEKVRFEIRSGLLLATFYSAGVIILFLLGPVGSGGFYLIAFAILTINLFPVRWGVGAIILSTVTWFGIALYFQISQAQPILVALSHQWTYLIFGVINLLVTMLSLSQTQTMLSEANDYIKFITEQKQELLDTRNELTQRSSALNHERYLLHKLLDTVSDRIFFKDLSGRYTRISKAYARQVGIPPEEMLGKKDSDIFSSPYARQITEDEIRIITDGEAIFDRVEHESWIDGRPDTWVITNRLPLIGEDQHIAGVFGTSRDITQIKKAEEAAQRQSRQLAAAAKVSRAITSIFILDDLLKTLVKLLQTSFGYYSVTVWLIADNELEAYLRAGINASGEDLSHFSVSLPLDTTSLITEVCRNGIEYLCQDTSDDWKFMPFAPFPDTRSELVLPLRKGKKVTGVLCMDHDFPNAFHEDDLVQMQSLADQVTIAIENARLFETVQKLATVDGLTGVSNRRQLMANGVREVERALRYHKPLCALMIDIDHFKYVNDSYGHAVGDMVLKAIAAECQKMLRSSDIMGRYGGEEFVIILTETNLEAAEITANRLRMMIQNVEVNSKNEAICVTVSIGLAMLNEDTTLTFDALLDNADHAMYEAKQSGRNRVCVYQE